jgi:hypothetical protein
LPFSSRRTPNASRIASADGTPAWPFFRRLEQLARGVDHERLRFAVVAQPIFSSISFCSCSSSIVR